MKNIKLTFFKIGRMWMWFCTFSFTAVLVALAALFLIDPFFFQKDGCLDAGGRWDEASGQCIHQQTDSLEENGRGDRI